MAQVGSIIVSLEAKIDSLQRGFDKANRQFDQIDRNTQKLQQGFRRFERVAASVGAALAAIGVGALVKQSIQATAEVGKLADALGLSSEALSTWQFAAQQAGINADKIGDIFKDTSDKLGDFASTGGGEAKDLFERLNLDIQQLINLSPDQQLLKIAEALDAVQSRSEKIFLLESLADDASRLLPLLENNAEGFRKLQKEAEKLGVVIGEDQVRAARQADMALVRLNSAFDALIRTTLSNGALDGITKAIDDITTKLSDPAAQQGIATLSANLGSLISLIVENSSTILKVMGALTGAKAGAMLGTILGPKGRIGGALLGAAAGLALTQEEVARADEIRQKIKDIEGSLARAAQLGLPQETIETGKRALADYRAELAAIEEAGRRAAEALTLNANTPAGIAPPPFTPPTPPNITGLSEAEKAQQRLQAAFEATEDALRRQIILHGETSEAAQLNYELQFGALRDLDQKQQNQLMILAKRKDLMDAQAEASVEAARKQQEAQDRVNRKLEESKRFVQDLGFTFSSAFEAAILKANSLSDVLKGLAQDILAITTRRLVTEPLAAGISNIASGFFHEGGIVGQGGISRQMPALAFAGAPRYHTGGLAGLKPDERPAILQMGEEVLTRDDPRHRNNQRGGNSVQNHYHSNIQIDARGAEPGVENRIRAAVTEAVQRSKSEIFQSIERGGQFARAVGRKM